MVGQLTPLLFSEITYWPLVQGELPEDNHNSILFIHYLRLTIIFIYIVIVKKIKYRIHLQG